MNTIKHLLVGFGRFVSKCISDSS